MEPMRCGSKEHFISALESLVQESPSEDRLSRIKALVEANFEQVADAATGKKVKALLKPLKVEVLQSLYLRRDRELVYQIMHVVKGVGRPPDESCAWKETSFSKWEIKQFRKALARDDEFCANYRFLESAERPDSYLGRGNEGVVYLAENIHTRQRMAIKVKCENRTDYNGYNGAEEVAAVELFQKATNYEFVAENYAIFNAKTYIEGPTLLELLNSNRLFDNSTASLMMLDKLKELLTVVVEKGVYFDDIAPENFMYDINRNTFYIVDLRPFVNYGSDVAATRAAYKEQIFNSCINWVDKRWYSDECPPEARESFLKAVQHALG